MSTPRFADLIERYDYRDVAPAALLSPAPVAALPHTLSHRGLIYAAVPGWRPHRLDLHVPQHIPAPWPVVVYVHGGSFVTGIPEMGPWAALPAVGIAVAAISYRLAGEAPFPEAVEDVRAAVRWVRSAADAFGLDPTRISLWGSSAGALLAGIAAVSGRTPLGEPVGDTDQSAEVRSMIAHYGVSDAGRLVDDAIAGGEPSARRLAGILAAYTSRTHVAPAVAAHLGPDVRPDYLLVHGDSDTRVGSAQSVRLHEQLHAHGFRSSLTTIPGAGHGTSEFFDEKAIDMAVDFLRCSWTR